MTDTARNIQPTDPADTEGLEGLFEQAPVTSAQEPVTVTGAEPVTGAQAPVPGVPVELAATVLGTSINALKKRLRKGTLRGYKQETKHGEKWFVDQSELDGTPAPVTVDPEPVPTSAEPVTCAIEPVPTYAQPVELIDKIRELEAKLEGATYRNGYLEAENEGLKTLLGAKDTQIMLLTDRQHKSGWWARFAAWFFKAQ